MRLRHPFTYKEPKAFLQWTYCLLLSGWRMRVIGTRHADLAQNLAECQYVTRLALNISFTTCAACHRGLGWHAAPQQTMSISKTGFLVRWAWDSDVTMGDSRGGERS